MSDDELLKLLDEATQGKRVQFHPSYCVEAIGTEPYEWDSSKEMSVITPEGRRCSIAQYWRGADVCLSKAAPTIARELLEARATIREMALQLLSDDGQMADKIDELVKENEELKSQIEEYKSILSRD